MADRPGRAKQGFAPENGDVVRVPSHDSSYCFVHIGAPKTGTTFLQKTLFDNREGLARRGLLYPDVSLRGYGHHDFAFLLGNGYPDWATPQQKTLATLTRGLQRSVASYEGSVLLSSEDFYLFPAPGALHALLEKAMVLKQRQLRIIVYVRRQDLAHESWYNQTIKAQGKTHSLHECIEYSDALWDYEANLQQWAAIFGDANIIVRPYERAQFSGGSLAADFLNVVGVAAEGLTLPPENVNSGINGDLLEFQRLLNGLPVSIGQKRRFHKQFIELSRRAAGTGIFDERPLIARSDRQNILGRYEQGNRAVARRFLSRDQLFYEPVVGEVESHSGAIGVEALARIMGWLMVNAEGANDV